MLNRLWSALVNPKVDDQTLEQQLTQLQSQLPPPIFWLLGKTQAGKTSLIKALTGDSRAQIGDGFRACTQRAASYDFPSPSHPFIRFLDTRGLGEVDYDPSEDIAQFQRQTHLLIVVFKAMDLAQKPVLEAFRAIYRVRPQPVIVLQTALHEGYPAGEREHPKPYPFDHQPLPLSLPTTLAQRLTLQRSWFEGIPAHFVAVDFTLPEDRFIPSDYGLPQLWAAIEAVLPAGMVALVRHHDRLGKPIKDAYAQAADAHITGYAVAAAAAAAVPVPFADVPLVGAIQAKMAHAIASIYNQPFDRRNLWELVSTLGIGFTAQWGRRELVKFVPVYGTALSALLTAAATYALGKTLMAYFSSVRHGDTPDPAIFQRLYQEQFEIGRQRLATLIKQRPG